MATTDMAMGVIGKYSVATAVALALANVAHANSSLNFTPFVSIEEIYSNNVEQDAIDTEDSFVTRTNFGVDTNIDSAKLKASVNGTLSHLMYSHDSDANKGYESANATINYTPWQNALSLNLSGNISNGPRNIGSNLGSDLVSGDTVRTSNYSAGLSYQVNNSDFIFSANSQYSENSSDDDVGESKGHNSAINFQNGSGIHSIFWTVTGSYSDRENRGETGRSHRIDARFGFNTPWRLSPFIRYYDEEYSGSISNNNLNQSNSTGAGLRWSISDRLVWNLSYNIVDDDSVGDDYIDTDISWQPSIRTSIAASFSERFFGESYGLNVSHRNKRMTNTISYNESVQAFQRDRLESFIESTVFCPIGATETIDDCFSQLDPSDDPSGFVEIPILGIRSVEDDQFSLFKTLAWNSSLNLKRTTFSLDISGNERQDLNTDSIRKTVGINFTASRRLNSKSDVSLSWRFTRNNFETEQTDIQTEETVDYYHSYTANYSRQLGETLSLDLNVRYLNRESNNNFRVYDETRATLSVRKDF
ncbi:MAG: TIGR03016 family PEP-CTERM system-associated outer membrane protein [Colwelliaceae bacterium]|nr:TIGR03016 family PEP-CTERM system-associated outer membrane protein [Colwelliaceae bacterium]